MTAGSELLTLPPIPANSTPVHDSGCYWSRQGQTLGAAAANKQDWLLVWNGATKQSCHITGGEIPTVPNPSLTWLQQGGLTSCQNSVESLPGRQVPDTGCSSSPSVRFLGKIPFPWEPLSQWSDSKREGYRCLFRKSSLGSGRFQYTLPLMGQPPSATGKAATTLLLRAGELSNELAISRRNSLFQSPRLQHSENLGRLLCSSRPMWATKQLPGQRGWRLKITSLKNNQTNKQTLATKEGLEMWLGRESLPSVPQVTASLRFR